MGTERQYTEILKHLGKLQAIHITPYGRIITRKALIDSLNITNYIYYDVLDACLLELEAMNKITLAKDYDLIVGIYPLN